MHEQYLLAQFSIVHNRYNRDNRYEDHRKDRDQRHRLSDAVVDGKRS